MSAMATHLGLLPVEVVTSQHEKQHMLARLRQSPVGLIGMVIVILVLLAAAFAPLVAPHDPAAMDMRARLVPPGWSQEGSWDHPLGTDQLGRDVLSRILYGSRISVLVGVTAVIVSGMIGIAVGLASGFYGGALDAFLSRLVDAFTALPFIVFALAVIGVLGPGLLNLVIVLGLTGWVTYARVVRAEVLAAKELDYVLAARVSGLSEPGIAIRHILRNVSAPIIVLATLSVATAIIAESSLSFLGLGVQPPIVTWGSMLADGRDHVATSWWLAAFPGLAITIAVLGIIFVGDWLRDILDPRLNV
jgi:peptide/nickel transport system permease protein